MNDSISAFNDKRQTDSMRITPLGFYLRVVVNEKPLNLVKTTSSVISVLSLLFGSNVVFHMLLLNICIRILYFSLFNIQGITLGA